MDNRLEEMIEEISRNEYLEMELHRVNRELLSLKRRLNGFQKREKMHQRIISKQNKRIQEYEHKQMYINVQKGVKKKRR